MKTTLILTVGVAAGIWVSRFARRYGGTFLWWLFGAGK